MRHDESCSRAAPHFIARRGAFLTTLNAHKAAGTMPALLWQHEDDKPIGIWQEMVEDTRGLRVKGQLALETSRGKEAHALLKMGATRIYGIIGTSNVAFVDALYAVRDRIRYISCRHEQVAASMADAEGRLTGRPGVVMVHSGPGALNAIRTTPGPNDATPILAFTADAESDDRLFALGFQDIVAKPLQPGALIAAVARASDFSPQPWSAALAG